MTDFNYRKVPNVSSLSRHWRHTEMSNNLRRNNTGKGKQVATKTVRFALCTAIYRNGGHCRVHMGSEWKYSERLIRNVTEGSSLNMAAHKTWVCCKHGRVSIHGTCLFVSPYCQRQWTRDCLTRSVKFVQLNNNCCLLMFSCEACVMEDTCTNFCTKNSSSTMLCKNWCTEKETVVELANELTAWHSLRYCTFWTRWAGKQTK